MKTNTWNIAILAVAIGMALDSSARVFPAWQDADSPSAQVPSTLLEETRALLEQGRRDHAASPAFLDALQAVLDRHATDAPVAPTSSSLPFHPDFSGSAMPAGWTAIVPSVWRFGDGSVRQIVSQANTRYILSYAPGTEWKDYAVTFRFESDAWSNSTMNSCAVLYFRHQSLDGSYSLEWEGNGSLTLFDWQKQYPGPDYNRRRLLIRTPVDPAVIRDGKPWTVSVCGNEIRVTHEGATQLFATDSSHAVGTIGLESIHIPMTFSSVDVVPLP